MRVSTIVLGLSCLLAGYVAGIPRVSALEDVSPARRLPSAMNVGTHVRLWFASDPKLIDCTVSRIDAGWVRCTVPDDPFGPRQEEIWYDLGHVVSVTKVEPQR